jgi:hypothetical protein
MCPPLQEAYPRLIEYFVSGDRKLKGPFLEALKNEGMVWDDCIMHPLHTSQVYSLLNDSSFLKALSIHLSRLPFERMILISTKLGPLKRGIERNLTDAGNMTGKSVYLFQMNFWQRPVSEETMRWTNAARSAELRRALSAPLSG